MTFSNKINNMLVEKKKYDLSLLVEEENLFDMPEEDKSETEEDKSETEEDKVESETDDVEAESSKDLDNSSSDGDKDNSTDGKAGEIDLEQIKTMNKKIENIGKTLDKSKSNYPDIENFIASNLRTEAKNYSGKSIKSFFLVENEDMLKDTEENIDALDRILKKGSDLISTFAQKGDDLDIQSYVDVAINAYKNFDNLFSKEDIVKQATINVLLLNSGENSSSAIDQFEELYHEELNRQFGIEREEHALIVKKNNVAAGAVGQN